MEEIKCEQVATLCGCKWEKLHDANRRVYSDKGLSPTITTMGGGQREPKIIEPVISECRQIELYKEVRVRKHQVDIKGLQAVLKANKKFTNKEIAEKLNVPITKVEHWFRTDKSFSIPDENDWLKLKQLLDISTDEFDKQITEFEIKPNKYDMSNRAYLDSGCSPTIMSSGEINIAETIVNIEPVCINSKVNGKQPSLTNRVYDTEAISTCVTTSPFFMGSVAEPIAYDEQNRYLRQDGCVGTITTDGSSPKHNNRVVEPLIVDDIYHSRDARVYDDCPTLRAERQGLKVVEPIIYDDYNGRVRADQDTIGTLTTNCGNDAPRNGVKIIKPQAEYIGCAVHPDGYKDTECPTLLATDYKCPKTVAFKDEPNYRIRKLTERECFRLQGVKNEDFEDVAKNQSTSALYHESGDSICSTCLMAIFGKLFGVDYQTKIQELVKELKQ